MPRQGDLSTDVQLAQSKEVWLKAKLQGIQRGDRNYQKKIETHFGNVSSPFYQNTDWRRDALGLNTKITQINQKIAEKSISTRPILKKGILAQIKNPKQK